MSPWRLGAVLATVATATAAQAPVKPADVINPRLLQESLAGPMAGVEEIVFAVRNAGDPKFEPHWYANIGYYAHDENLRPYFDGGRLCKLNLRTGNVQVLLDDPRGGVRDPQVNYEGDKILFSYRKGGTPYYHLYEIKTDGKGMKELTTGPWDDFEPTYTAYGDIVFVSTRAKRWVNCWKTQVAVLYRMDADGSDMRPISSNGEHDNTPWTLPDGRILYTRWEYTDRSQVHYHHLWTANPDGTQQSMFYGNLHPGVVMIDAKPIAGTRKVVASFSPGHGRFEHNGPITVVDPSAGPDNLSFARQITKTNDYRDPWAFSENLFLAVRGQHMVLVDGSGARQEIYRLPAADLAANLAVHEPRPLMPRPRERVIPPRVDLAKANGTLILSDIYKGRNMEGVRRGEIKKLLVLEVLPMPIHYTGGPEQISFLGTFTLERIVGTVPVEPDGSAYFELPALRSFLFVALDEKDLSVKRMQSWMTVQPGEVQGCVGCHEQRNEAPPNVAGSLLALRRAPDRVEPITDVPEVFDFTRDVQPILNRNCLRCHDYDRREGDVILSGDHGPVYSHSYFTLVIRHQVADGQNRAESNYAPRTLGSSASNLMQKLEPSHHDVRTTPHERKMIRLWIDSGAPYAGTYASEGTSQIGVNNEGQPERPVVPEWPMMKPAEEAIMRKCNGCHEKTLPVPLSVVKDEKAPEFDQPKLPGYPRPWGKWGEYTSRFSRNIVFNLTRPEKSMMLLAPLSRQDGGYGICKARVFEGASDPDYRAILAAIREGKDKLDEMKRFDMPGFIPRYAWVREMKRFGILPADHNPAKPVDYYALERRYWESLWYYPETSRAQQ